MSSPVVAHSFTDEEIKNMKEAFELIDRDSSGQLTKDEVKEFLKSVKLSEKITDLLYFLFDGTDEKGITYDDFQHFFVFLENLEKDPYFFVKEVFTKMDKDNTGTISKKDITKLANLLGVVGTDTQYTRMFESIDTNNDGTISLEELLDII